jgi:hypothetical protein
MTEQDYEQRYEPQPAALDQARAALEPFSVITGFTDRLERFEAAVRANERATPPQPMDDDQARAVLAPLEAKVRELRARERAGHRSAALRDAADQYATLADQNEAYELAEHGSIDNESRLQLEAVRDVAAGLRRMADEAQAETEAQPARHRWYVETRDGTADQWAPGTRYTERRDAVDRHAVLTRHHPTWKDGTPAERRIVRETTTYTVEPTPEEA